MVHQPPLFGDGPADLLSVEENGMDVDIVVIGGGINGCGIAADAASRGLSVLLVEKDDLAAHTSSASTKLIHGGLRYLETYEFALVRKALQESEILLQLAPHLIEPLCIDLPYEPHHRPWWMIRAGLALYNSLARRPGYGRARSMTLTADSPLQARLTRGFRYYDGWVDDARLVVLNAVQAAVLGATVLPRTACTALKPEATGWQVSLRDRVTGADRKLRARAVVNAAGPWVSRVVADTAAIAPHMQVRLVKGSHIVVPAIPPMDRAWLFQNPDGRIIFMIPYLERFTLIGTTEVEYGGDLDQVTIDEAEVQYLLTAVNAYLKTPLGPQQVLHSYAGVRPLLEDGRSSASRVSRDYRLIFETTSAPLLSIYGGKITTYRLLAEQAIDLLGTRLGGVASSRTRHLPLPGGDFQRRETLEQAYAKLAPDADGDTVRRWVRAYGTRAQTFLVQAPGRDFGHGLYEREVAYLVDQEWARDADDILWRRSKLGYRFSAAQREELQTYLQSLRATG